MILLLALSAALPALPGDAINTTAGISVRLEQPQAFTRGMVRPGLLEMLNRFQAGKRDREGALNPQAFAQFKINARGVVAADASGRISYVFTKMPIAVDASADRRRGDAKARLRPLKDALSSLSSYRLRPVLKDTRGNRLGWTGRRAGIEVHVLYKPEVDELWVLAVSASR